MNDLKDTIQLMISKDYKDRFKAEYYQTKIRLEKLYEMLVRYDAGTLGFTPECSIALLKAHQQKYGYTYTYIPDRATAAAKGKAKATTGKNNTPVVNTAAQYGVQISFFDEDFKSN